MDGVKETLHEEAEEFTGASVQLDVLKLPVPPLQLTVPFGIDCVGKSES